MADPQDTATDPSDDWAAALAEQASAEGTGGESADDLFAQAGGGVSKANDLFKSLDSVKSVGGNNDIDMVMDIPVQLTVELGRTKIPIKHILQLAQGSVIELDGLAGEPMDVLVNGYLIAQGEVVVVNDKFGIRLTDIITPSERLRKLNR